MVMQDKIIVVLGYLDIIISTCLQYYIKTDQILLLVFGVMSVMLLRI